MNIMIFSEAAWDDTNSFGNTVSNLFAGDVWKRDTFIDFYARNQLPDNQCNVRYYHLSAVDILKGALHLSVKGREFSGGDIPGMRNVPGQSQTDEQHMIDRLHKTNNQLIYWGHEMVWKSRIWLNRYFRSFVMKDPPDILFAFATSSYILWPLIQYLKKYTGCRIVLLVADDTYGAAEKYAFYRRIYQKRDLRKCILAADKLYAISDEMTQLYKRLFGKEITTLYKGCDLSAEPKGYSNHPMRFVYAGNLSYGRDDCLAAVAETIEKNNENGIKAVLEIYTGTTVTPELMMKLNRGESSRIVGPRSYSEIKRIMHGADVVLHVESFDEKMIETVKYSLSSKITDCLQSGAQVLGIGPDGIASVEYLKKVEGAIVVSSPGEIEKQITALLSDSHMQDRIQKTRRYALENHEISKVQSGLRSQFELLSDRKTILI